ncbi:uncharacterized protein LOC112575799 [Pomacea canaliculata]|uniref:uncharacterized protein LOC112575799 n=1 Tax=Pomacea canaliculata TaxID=400727 RepID=UPI000D738D73|nr:uncharacterized protein LOC112575799 [Pomacea canaliculata]
MAVTSKEYPDDPISQETEQFVTKVRGVTIMPVLFIIGTVGTSVSLTIFYKQGLTNRINLCLFSLELVNLLNVLFLVLLNIDSLYKTMEEGLYGDVFRFIMNDRLLGMLGFMYCSMYLTALASCFKLVETITFRKQTSSSDTRRETAATKMLVILSVQFLVLSIPNIVIRMVPLFEPEEYPDDPISQETEHLVTKLRGVTIMPLMFIVGTVGTSISLIVFYKQAFKLVQTVTFRKQSSSSSDTKREIAATKILVILSVVFLIFSVPNIVIRMAKIVEAEVQSNGRYNNTFVVLVNCAEAGSIINSSVNFVVYFCAGTKYRESVSDLFSCLRRKKSSNDNKHQQKNFSC